MNTVDIVLIILIAAALVWAFSVCIGNRKKGKGCCGSCSECSGCAGDEQVKCYRKEKL